MKTDVKDVTAYLQIKPLGDEHAVTSSWCLLMGLSLMLVQICKILMNARALSHIP